MKMRFLIPALLPLFAWAAGCGSSTDTNGLGSGQNGGPGNGAGGSGTLAGVGTHFPGSGQGYAAAPLDPNSGPETAGECPAPPKIQTAPPQVVSTTSTCFFGATSNPNAPAAVIEQIVEVVNGKQVVHIRITFDPGFVDNTYGTNAIGWGGGDAGAAAAPTMPGGAMMGPGGKPKPPPKGHGGHTFNDLVGSDHVELTLNDTTGKTSLQMDVDYISQDSSSPCGYKTLGVSGGEGKMLVGDASSVLAVATSLDRDLNGCGYCETTDSPATNSSYTPNPATPKWDYRVVYELWIDASAFGSAGFGSALITSVHASPSKIPGTNTVTVEPKPCPPGWDVPACDPSTSGEGVNCGSSGYGDGGPGVCPPGFVPDLASEGRFCVPE